MWVWALLLMLLSIGLLVASPFLAAKVDESRERRFSEEIDDGWDED